MERTPGCYFVVAIVESKEGVSHGWKKVCDMLCAMGGKRCVV